MPQISLNSIVAEEDTQFRAEPADPDYIATLATAYKQPDHSIPPVRLFSDGARFHVGDGHRRIQGAKSAGKTQIDAIVKEGGKAAAIQFALGANEENGERRTAATRRKCVEAALGMDEHKDKTDRALADICRVSHTFVAAVRKEAPKNGESTVNRTRRGRDGKVYKAAPSDADENPSSVVCQRCTRVGPVKGCPQCKTLRESAGAKAAAKKRSKAGQLVYDWKSADAMFGHAVRELDNVTNAYKGYPDWPDIHSKYVKGWRRLLDELATVRDAARKTLLKLKD